MTIKPTVVILGASLAGACVAESARESRVSRVAIVLVGDEPSRARRASAAVQGRPAGRGPSGEPTSTRAGFYADHGVELAHRQGDRDPRLAPPRRLVRRWTLSVRLRIVFATGAEPRTAPLPGADLAGVHYLRTIDDCPFLPRRDSRGPPRSAVIGAGWIGSEVAASARQMGADVVLIEPAPAPLDRVLGEEIGGVFRDLHADHGVALRLGARR